MTEMDTLPAADSTSSTRWSTYTHSESPSSHTDLPAPLRVFQIGRDFILAGSADSLGVETGELYHLGPLPGAAIVGVAESAPPHGHRILPWSPCSRVS
jgi:hypothetical protein